MRRKTLDFVTDAPSDSEALRFWAKVAPSESGCWNWVGARDRNGYPYFRRGAGVNCYGHRWVYAMANGGLDHAHEIDHWCNNPSCVNPAHLRVMSHKENCRRGQRATKTHCVRGHRLSGENLYESALRRGARRCKTCARLVGRLRYLNQKYNPDDEERMDEAEMDRV